MLTCEVMKTVTVNGHKFTYIEGSCKSTDTKPVDGIYNGSKLVEMNTGNVMIFDGDSHTWTNL